MPGTLELLDLHPIISEFVADPMRLSTELPHMSTGERKQAKKILELYPELKCESYGFGNERKLHLFKVAGEASSASAQKMCSGDSILIESGEAPLGASVSVPTVATLSKNAVQCVMDGPVCKLDLTSITGLTDSANEWGQACCPDASTACPSDASPASTFRGGLPWLRLPPGLPAVLELEVHNTFIDYREPPTDGRAVQSMPHCMFRQCLLAESLSCHEKAATQVSDVVGDFDTPLPTALLTEIGEEDRTLTAGTEVVIEGLSKLPAFNGLRGMLQSFDEQSGRYTISLEFPVFGHKIVKVKRENFHLAPRWY